MTRVHAAGGEPGDRLRMKLPAHLMLIFLLALTVRLLHLGDSPWIDEFYHILAARSWLEDGSLHINEGGREYGRAALFTYIVAGFIALFGDSLEVARLPAVLFGALWVTAVFAWTWWAAGRLAAWIAGGWFALDAGAIVLSQFARFYTLHGLLFFLGVAAVYVLVATRPERRIAVPLGLSAIALLAFADYFQVTTRIGIFALAIWLLLAAVPLMLTVVRRTPMVGAVGAAAIVLAAAVAFLIFHEQIAYHWHRFNSAATWASVHAADPFYYYMWFNRYATFWALLPVAVVVGLVLRPSLTSFCVVMFGVPFVLHSFAAFKSERYLFYAIPFFFILWAVVLAQALPWLHGRVSELVLRAGAALGGDADRRRAHGAVQHAVTAIILVAVLGFLGYNNPGFIMSFRTLVPKETGRPYAQANWERSAPLLRELADEADVVLTTAYTKTLYYIGDFDIGLGRDIVEDSYPGGEFGPERVTARPSISTEASLEIILNCYWSGLVIVDWGHLNNEFVVNPAVSRYLDLHMERLEIPGESRLTVFRWRAQRVWPPGRCRKMGLPVEGAAVDAIGSGTPVRTPVLSLAVQRMSSDREATSAARPTAGGGDTGRQSPRAPATSTGASRTSERLRRGPR
jgi:hypothetical protein